MTEYIRGRAWVEQVGDKVREARLRWWGHVKYGDAKHGERWKIADEFHGCGEGGHEVR